MSKTTKPTTMTSEFRAAAIADPNGAMAFMFLSAFGVDLSSLVTIALKLVSTKDVPIILMAINAAVQIRSNVTFVGPEHGKIKSKYPELIIEGSRNVPDVFNFSALHALGHVLCHLSSHGLARNALKKAGSCVTGEGCPDSDAGKINKEVAISWSTDDINLFGKVRSDFTADQSKVLNDVFISLPGLKAAFAPIKAPSAPSSRPPPTTA